MVEKYSVIKMSIPSILLPKLFLYAVLLQLNTCYFLPVVLIILMFLGDERRLPITNMSYLSLVVNFDLTYQKMYQMDEMLFNVPDFSTERAVKVYPIEIF